MNSNYTLGDRTAEVRRLIDEARADPRLPVDADVVFDRLIAKFEARSIPAAPERR